MMDIKQALELVETEARAATELWQPFNSVHEGYAVLLEEVDELWEAIKMRPRNMNNVKGEVIQVGAMAIRFLADLIQEEGGGEVE